MNRENIYPYFSYDKENSILTHEITDANFSDDKSFVVSVSYFITLIDKYRPNGILIKVLKEPVNRETKLDRFMNDVVLKTINDSHVKRIAFYFSEPKFLDPANHGVLKGQFTAKVFTDLNVAIEWLKEV